MSAKPLHARVGVHLEWTPCAFHQGASLGCQFAFQRPPPAGGCALGPNKPPAGGGRGGTRSGRAGSALLVRFPPWSHPGPAYWTGSGGLNGLQTGCPRAPR